MLRYRGALLASALSALLAVVAGAETLSGTSHAIVGGSFSSNTTTRLQGGVFEADATLGESAAGHLASDPEGALVASGIWPLTRHQPDVDSPWALLGIATGGTIDFVMNGVVFQLVTEAGQTAGEIAAEIADLINASAALDALRVSADVSENVVHSDGTYDLRSIDDAGLSPDIPALSLLGALSLAATLAAFAHRRSFSRGRTRGPAPRSG